MGKAQSRELRGFPGHNRWTVQLEKSPRGRGAEGERDVTCGLFPSLLAGAVP